MSSFTKRLRGLLLCLPIIAVSGFAIFEVTAQTTPPTLPTGEISTQTMADYTSYPSGINALAAPNVQPLIMLVMSRDEQLFNKAYPDYTALAAGGQINTTYLDSFAYNGYFDPDICYSYSTSSNYYQAVASVNTGSHACAGGAYWSGNFLNWVAMSRLDILRWTFYGGTRSTDTATTTVLERAEIPDDLHAWAKVYSGTDINLYTPFTGTTTFCNVSTGSTGGWNRATTTSSGVNSTPVIRVASGDWGDWASTAKVQCQNQQGSDDGGNSARPPNSQIASLDYKARVLVCQNAAGVPDESFCVTDGTALKPEGLLQQYSKPGESAKRFGLVTGSDVKARLAGQLRRNVGLLANNVTGAACAVGTGAGDGDEFSSVDGTFCYKSVATKPAEGIVMTLDRLQIIGWNGSDYGDSLPAGCFGPNAPWGARGYLIQANPTMCPDFGNPVASMYATALDYIQGASAPSQDPAGSDNLPNPAWVDPYGTAAGAGKPRNEPCAACSIVLVSSGLNTFDAQNVPPISNLNPVMLTNTIRTNEGMTGQYELSTYFNTSSLGGAPANGSLTTAGTGFSDIAICAPATIGNLSDLSGICNGTPGQQGSYLLAGLSYGAWSTVPFRTDGKVAGNFQVKTYGVSLSDNLPSFSIPVGTSGSISISPSCTADPESLGTYASCFLGSVRIGAQHSYNTTNATGYNTYGLVPTSSTDTSVGSFYFVWEDSQYGSDHDQDANNVISYCVGTSCSRASSVVTGGVAICDPVVTSNPRQTYNDTSGVLGGVCNKNGTLAVTLAANTILIRNQLVAFSSVGMNLGFEVSGTSADGLYEFHFTSGGGQSSIDSNGAVFNCELLGNIPCQSQPVVQAFTLGTSAPVSTLQTPLWYAAKYSGYAGSTPLLPTGQDPSNYFFARNAGLLKAQLNAIFQSIVSPAANNFGNATTPSSSNDISGNGLSYQVQYFRQLNDVNWTGNLRAFWSDSNGYQRVGSIVGGNEVLSPTADYIVGGPDTTAGALPGATANYRCTIAPVPPAGSTGFDPSAYPAGCSIVSSTNLLQPAWDATTLLNAVYDPATTDGVLAIANLAKQRAYGDDASAAVNLGQRYIFTYLTQTPNGSTGTGTVVNGTQTDFVWNVASCDPVTGAYTLSATSGFCGGIGITPGTRTGNYGLLNEQSPVLAKNLVNWIRGVEDPVDYRSRTSDVAASPGTYRLGDIVDSSPAIAGTPAESYDVLYNDFTYTAFRSNYSNRRQMIYVGANDGMLHAFNGGFYVPGQAASGSTPATNPTIFRQLPAATANSNLVSGDTANPKGLNWALGQEAWAFVPDNLLPHLRWLADQSYTHVFYVDGSPALSDVQVWGEGGSAGCQAGAPAAPDLDAHGHVCGWGTVMVVPFRLGGGPITVDTTGDRSATATNTRTSNSAYVILDVTDPEQPPTVLGEITTGTFALGAPAFAVHRESDGKLHFLLTIGSGPADNGGPSGTTSKPVSAPAGASLGVWVYDLADIVAHGSTPAAALTSTSTDAQDSFAGDMVAADFNLNYSTEGVYFGVVTNPPPPTGTPPVSQPYAGGLWKVNMNTGTSPTNDISNPGSWTLTEVINTGQPVTIRPTVATDSSGRRMIYFGTGRAYTTDDNSGTSAQGTQQQYIYGVSDNSLLTGLATGCPAMPSIGSLFNAASSVVSTRGTVTGSGIGSVSTLASLQAALMATNPATGCYQYSGWELPLTNGNSASNVRQPSERVISSQTLFNSILLTPTYIPPNAAQIAATGSSDCNPIPVPGTSYLYGLNYLTGTADPSLANGFGTSAGNVSGSVSLGSGIASAPVLHVGADGKVSAAFGIGGGTKLQRLGPLGQAANGEISWREPVDNQ